MATEQYRPMTVRDFYAALQQFVRDNERSVSVEERWLADYMKAVIPAITEIKDSRIGPETREKINSFRAIEIENDIRDKRRALERAENELKKIKAA